VSIHYAHDVNRNNAKTACGHVFDMCQSGECLSGDPASVDCEKCLASDEMVAEAMESSIIDLIDSKPFSRQPVALTGRTPS
jgi:hypothetical protein